MAAFLLTGGSSISGHLWLRIPLAGDNFKKQVQGAHEVADRRILK